MGSVLSLLFRGGVVETRSAMEPWQADLELLVRPGLLTNL